MPPSWCLPLLLLPASALGAQSLPEGGSDHAAARAVQALERVAPVTLDGRLDEPLWQTAPAATDFLQREPDEGRPATQRTEVRFAYDADALYIGARMFDSLGGAGVRTVLARRDQEVEGDHVRFVFDTFHDHVGQTIFQVNPSGVKYDAGQAASFADPSWDPVWQAATQVDSLGWTAEIRIPFSQLRFPRDSLQTWGLQVWRRVDRLNELSMWSFWRTDEAGGPARFGHLESLRFTSRPLGIELLPYVVGRASYVQPGQPGSPFESASAYTTRIGVDVKALLTSNLTLDATFNPDFGQVEVDPAVVNLSAFETFFPERRPFFIEGSGLFGFGGFNCYFCSNVSSMSLFYSRRIGRAPQSSLGALGHATRYASAPENTAILGAAKVTGRTAGGLQVGVLNAVTGAAHADAISLEGEAVRREVEPLTNYFVGRLRRNYRDGNLVLGAIGTSVARSFEYDSLRQRLPGRAEAVGVDWNLRWRDRTYSLMGNFALSRVSGDSAAILRLQRSSARYFQRPDRDQRDGFFSDRYDPSATSLRGYGGYTRLAKDAGAVLWEAALNYRSPGFEVNDMAFLTRSDYLWMNANLFRPWTRPTRHYRRADFIVGGQQQLNYDGDVTDRQLHVFGGLQLPNYWSINSFFILRPETDDDRLTRGGPVVRRARTWTAFANFGSDARRRVVLSSNPWYGRNAEGSRSYFVNLDARFRPATNVSISAGPAYTRTGSSAQFVQRFDDPTATYFHGQRVVFAELEQHTLSMDTRLNVTFRPTLSLELFAQPFVSSGAYRGFREFVRPRSLEKRTYTAGQLSPVLSEAGRVIEYVLVPTGDPEQARFTFANPDFNFRSMRGNAVVRWEYRPGSTLFLVWQQQRSGFGQFGDFDLARDAGNIFRERPDNIFLVKATYWFGK